MIIRAHIPARDGSMRVPNKNLKDFCGKPLIAWSILKCLAADVYDGVYVITDSKRIAKVAKEYGAEVIMQPPWQCQFGERGGSIAEAWFFYQLKKAGIPMDADSGFLCTTPLRKVNDYRRLVGKKLEVPQAQEIALSSRIVSLQLHEDNGDGTSRMILFDNTGKYMIPWAGSIHDVDYYVNNFCGGWHDIERFFETKDVQYMPKPVRPEDYPNKHIYYVEIEPWQWYDIDRLVDWEICEFWFKYKGLDKEV
uniref:Putative cytidylyltransferase n=2 Tax=viral metagenome TaxID=1070528 RepID=A0A6M3Y1T6_9ZZZZ